MRQVSLHRERAIIDNVSGTRATCTLMETVRFDNNTAGNPFLPGAGHVAVAARRFQLPVFPFPRKDKKPHLLSLVRWRA